MWLFYFKHQKHTLCQGWAQRGWTWGLWVSAHPSWMRCSWSQSWNCLHTPKLSPDLPTSNLLLYSCKLIYCWPAVCHFWTVWGPNSHWSQWKLKMNVDWWHCSCILGTTKQNKSGSAWHFNSSACSFLVAGRSESPHMLTCQVQQESCKNIGPVSFWL